MYELMVIAKTDSSDKVFEEVGKFLKDIDADSVRAEKLGKKILAYPIAKQTEAEYFLYNFEADAKSLKSLSDKIRLEQEAILRHMLVSKKVPKVSKVRKVSKEEDKIEKAKPKVTVTTRTKVSKVSKVLQVPKVKEKVASKKVKKTVKSTKKGKS